MAPPTAPTLPHLSDRAGAGVGDMALMFLESIADAVYIVDGEWRIAFANDSFAAHLGLPRAQLLGRLLWEVINPENRPRLEAAYERMKASGRPQAFVHESVMYPGRMLDVRLTPLMGGLGVVFRDVTRALDAERALATSEAHLRRALEGAAMGDWTWDAQTDRLTLSDRALALYGLGPESRHMTREDVRQRLIHPGDIDAVRAAAARAHAEQGQYDVEYRVRRGGGWRWMKAMGGPHVVDGRTLGAHGLVQDIHELKQANERLQAEIEERERSRQRQQLLIHELNHRVKNLLAMVQAIAMQTLSGADSPEAARTALELRLLALAGAHDVLTREGWDGADLVDVVGGAVAPHESPSSRRFIIQGPPVRLGPKLAVSLALALHELATNAVKYGALSNEEGWVRIEWTARPGDGGPELELTWRETGGPPVKAPGRAGFGSRLIARSLLAEEGGAEVTYAPEGVRCRLSARLPPASPASGAPRP